MKQIILNILSILIGLLGSMLLLYYFAMFSTYVRHLLSYTCDYEGGTAGLRLDICFYPLQTIFALSILFLAITFLVKEVLKRF